MTGEESAYGFYRDLAEWWPLISPPEEYTEGAACFANLLAWLRLIGGAGFRVVAVPESTTESRPAREMFLGTKPHPGSIGK